MGRSVRVAVVLLACGCRPDAKVAARAGDAELTVGRLSEVLAAWERRPLQWDFVDQFVRHWVDVALLAQRLGAGDSLLDTAVVLEAMWPPVREVLTYDFLSQVFAQRVSLDSAAIDSIYGAGEMRVLWHVLRRVRPQTSPEERAAQWTVAVRIRDRLRGGGSWEEASEFNEDGDTRFAGGNLGLIRRGEMAPSFEQAAFALEPGGLSDITETPFGFHIIYRPRYSETRERFARWAERALRADFDSLYGEQLLAESRLRMRPGVPATVREVAEFPVRYLDADDVLVDYRGGRFTVGRLVRWLQYLPLGVNEELIDASDERIFQALRDMIRQELLWNQADSAGMRPSDSLYTWVRRRYRSRLARVWRAVNLTPDSLAAAAATPDGRAGVALERVDEYLDAMAANVVSLQPVPPFLAEWLRGRADWEIRRGGVERAIERAREIRASGGAPGSNVGSGRSEVP